MWDWLWRCAARPYSPLLPPQRPYFFPNQIMRPFLHLLTPDQIDHILTEAKRLLHEIGVEVRGPALRQRLLDGGVEWDENGRFRFPPDVVDKAIATTPRHFDLYDRDGNRHARLGGQKVHFVPGSSGLKLLDHRTGEVRPAQTADFVRYVRLADGLEHIAYLATAFSTNDIPADVSDAWRLYLCLTNSIQPVVSGAFTEHGVPRMARMMQLFRQDRADLIARPLAIFTITPSGLFRYSEDSSQNLLDCVEWGIPIEIVPVTLMGLIAPVTLVEATIFHVADVLAGLTMAQIVKPGAPLLFGGAPAAFHMQTGAAPMAAIEAMRLDLAYVAVAQSLGLPTQTYMALGDGKLVDAQAGAETFGGALLAAIAGINSVSGPGMLDYVMTFSLAKLVLDNELCGQALHFVRDTESVNSTSVLDLAHDLLDEQHLLTHEHTNRHWPDELHLPGAVIDRDNRENWQKQGRPTLLQRANAEIERRLAAYTPVVTDPHLDAELRRLIQSGLPDGVALPTVPPPEVLAAASRPRRRVRRHRRGRS
ncbi:MAG: trimethylamine methyltransferase family protein [Anaerolineae bacterium]